MCPGTDLKLVAFDLESAIGGGAGDGAADSVGQRLRTIPMTSRSRRAGVPWMSRGAADRPDRPFRGRKRQADAQQAGGDDDVVIGREVAALIQTLVDGGGDQ